MFAWVLDNGDSLTESSSAVYLNLCYSALSSQLCCQMPFETMRKPSSRSDSRLMASSSTCKGFWQAPGWKRPQSMMLCSQTTVHSMLPQRTNCSRAWTAFPLLANNFDFTVGTQKTEVRHQLLPQQKPHMKPAIIVQRKPWRLFMISSYTSAACSPNMWTLTIKLIHNAKESSIFWHLYQTVWENNFLLWIFEWLECQIIGL